MGVDFLQLLSREVGAHVGNPRAGSIITGVMFRNISKLLFLLGPLLLKLFTFSHFLFGPFHFVLFSVRIQGSKRDLHHPVTQGLSLGWVWGPLHGIL